MEPKDSSIGETPKSQMKIVRDSTFHRASVDRVIVLNLGKDAELACLQMGPSLDLIADFGEQERLDLTPMATEVVRLRMPWASVVDFAMQTLQRGVEQDRIKVDVLKAAVEEWVSDSGTALIANESDKTADAT